MGILGTLGAAKPQVRKACGQSRNVFHPKTVTALVGQRTSHPTLRGCGTRRWTRRPAADALVFRKVKPCDQRLECSIVRHEMPNSGRLFSWRFRRVFGYFFVVRHFVAEQGANRCARAVVRLWPPSSCARLWRCMQAPFRTGAFFERSSDFGCETGFANSCCRPLTPRLILCKGMGL